MNDVCFWLRLRCVYSRRFRLSSVPVPVGAGECVEYVKVYELGIPDCARHLHTHTHTLTHSPRCLLIDQRGYCLRFDPA